MNIKKDELMENYEMGDEIFQEYISEQISKELKKKFVYYQKHIGVKYNNKWDFSEYAEIELKKGIRNCYKKLSFEKIFANKSRILLNKLPKILNEKERENMQNYIQELYELPIKIKKKIKLNKIFNLFKKYLYVKNLPRANEM